MKKFLILFLSIVTILLILLVSFNMMINVEPNQYTKINAEEMSELSESKENYIVYFYQENCPGCKKVEPILNEYVEESNRTIYAIDVNKEENIDYLVNDVNIRETPTLISYNTGEESERFIGVFTKNKLKKIAEDNNI